MIGASHRGLHWEKIRGNRSRLRCQENLMDIDFVGNVNEVIISNGKHVNAIKHFSK